MGTPWQHLGVARGMDSDILVFAQEHRSGKEACAWPGSGTKAIAKAVPALGTPGILRGEDLPFGLYVPFAQQTPYPVGKG